MNSYEMNLACIKNNKPFLYNSIITHDKSDTIGEAVEVFSEETYNNELALYIKNNDSMYRINSIYDPSFEADQWVKQFEFHGFNNNVLMYGLGNGVFLRSVLKKLHSKDVVLIYEPSIDVFLHVINEYDMVDILSDRRLLVAVENLNDKQFHFTLREVMNVTNLNTLIICSHPFYKEIFGQSCVGFWKEIKDCYRATIMSVNTEVLFGEKFIDNILKNIMFIRGNNTLPEIKSKIPKELPAIIIAAGPSVEKNIEELKKAKNKAVIFAVDRILDYLLDAGLEPDFVVTLDPAKPIEYFTRRDDVKIPMISFMQASHEVLKRHKGKKIFCNCSSFLKKAYLDNQKEVPNTSSSTSVATVAFTVCVNLGFQTIILVGQDLAYDGKVSHAGNVKENCGDHNDVMVEDIHGNQIRSRYDWHNFLVWYQDMIQLNSYLTVIDAKQAGAKITGTIVMPLKEAIQKYSIGYFDSRDFMEQFQPTFNKEELIRVKQYLEENLVILEKIKKKSKEAIKKCEFLVDEYKKSNIMNADMNDAVRKIGKINTFIKNQQLYTLIDLFIMSASVQEISELYHFTDDIHEDNIRTYERAKSVFGSIIKSLEFIRPRMEEAIRTID
jgi:hypothetical protein